ncbi:MAG: hypothetical protein JWN44_1494 [Myxococcales bacterium]|nr:hypothetical protein [Myxococcales bacterium]
MGCWVWPIVLARRIGGAVGLAEVFRAAVIAIALTWGAPVRAELPARLVVAGASACPTAAAVARAMERLHPRLRIEVGEGAGERIEIADDGVGYVVRAAGRERMLSDDARRCSERATAAAVAATLLLDPPVAPPRDEPPGPLAPRPTTPRPTTPAPTPPPTTSAAAETATSASRSGPASSSASSPVALPTPTTTRSSAPAPGRDDAPPLTVATVRRRSSPHSAALSRLELELSGVVDGAPAVADSGSTVTGGAALRLALGGRYVAATVGVAGLAPSNQRTPGTTGVDVGVTRVPFDAGVRLVLPRDRFEIGADVGLVLAFLRLSAPSLNNAIASTRLDVGARLAPWLRVWVHPRLAIQAGLELGIPFAVYDLVVEGTAAGKIGSSPRLWVGGALGLTVRL